MSVFKYIYVICILFYSPFSIPSSYICFPMLSVVKRTVTGETTKNKERNSKQMNSSPVLVRIWTN